MNLILFFGVLYDLESKFALEPGSVCPNLICHQIWLWSNEYCQTGKLSD